MIFLTERVEIFSTGNANQLFFLLRKVDSLFVAQSMCIISWEFETLIVSRKDNEVVEYYYEPVNVKEEVFRNMKICKLIR